MHGLPAATSLARALLTLSRARATGTLVVSSPLGSAHVGLREGALTALRIESDDVPALGDMLVARGALDADAHGRALRDGPVTGPVGEWLVRVGAASRPSVESALCLQLHERLAKVFRFPAAEFRVAFGSPDVGVPPLDPPLPVAEAVVSVMRGVAREIPLAEVRRCLFGGSLALTPLGRVLVAEALPSKDVAKAVAALEHGPQPVELLLALAPSSDGIRGLFVLRLLSAVGVPSPAASPFPLLLKKSRQLGRVGPRQMLDLPEGAAPREARRALRRLAATLHPDRLGDSAPPALRRASHEVMAALVEAEAHVRTAR